jgi:hypothetical protein
MDSMPAHRTSWKIRLVAFGIGIIVAAAVFGIALVISDDLRLLYLSGALLFAVAAFFLVAASTFLSNDATVAEESAASPRLFPARERKLRRVGMPPSLDA